MEKQILKNVVEKSLSFPPVIGRNVIKLNMDSVRWSVYKENIFECCK